MNEELKETAKAVQEVAKTSSKALETSEKMGSFIAKYIHGPLEQGMGIFEDKLKYIRWENQFKLMDKADAKLKERGIQQPTKPIPLKFAIPLLESASLEDDEYLQSLWVNLLVNSSTEHNGFTLERSYINVLEQLTNLEAQILTTIYSNNYSEEEKLYKIKTHMLPDKIEYTIEEPFDPVSEFDAAYDFEHADDPSYEIKKEEYINPSNEIKLALANLSRLQCIKFPFFDGAETYSIIHPTLFGEKLYNAVK